MEITLLQFVVVSNNVPFIISNSTLGLKQGRPIQASILNLKIRGNDYLNSLGHVSPLLNLERCAWTAGSPTWTRKSKLHTLSESFAHIVHATLQEILLLCLQGPPGMSPFRPFLPRHGQSHSTPAGLVHTIWIVPRFNPCCPTTSSQRPARKVPGKCQPNPGTPLLSISEKERTRVQRGPMGSGL